MGRLGIIGKEATSCAGLRLTKNQKDDHAPKDGIVYYYPYGCPLSPMAGLIFRIGPVQHRLPAAKVGLPVDMPIEQLFGDVVDVLQGLGFEVALAEKLGKAVEGRVPAHEGLME